MARRTSRGERQAGRREQRRGRRDLRRRLTRYAVIGGVGLLGLMVIVGLILPSIPARQQSAERPTGGPGTTVLDLGRRHFTPEETVPPGYYNSIPPTSGAHRPTWAKCGLYESPVLDENQVHSLEHGFVLVQYNTEDQAIISNLRDLVQSLPSYPDWLVLAPYPKMEQTIALTAWGKVQYLETVDATAIRAFAVAYRGRGPEAGAPSC